MDRRLGVVVIAGLAIVALVVALVLINDLHVTGRPSQAALRASPTVTRGLSTPFPMSVVTPIPFTTEAQSSPTVTSTPSPVRSSAAAAAASNPGQESLPILYDQSGQGNQTTPDFSVPSQWLLYWSFTCADGSTPSGALQVGVYLSGVDRAIKSFSNPAGKTAGVEHNYIGDGRYHLVIQTVCRWRVTVTPAQGQSVTGAPSSSP